MPKTLPLLVLLLTPALPARAAELAGVTMDDQITVDGQTLVLNGQGLRKKFFIKVYVAGLYLPAKQTAAEAVLSADTPRRMVMEFVRKVTKTQLCDGWKEGLEANTAQPSSAVTADFDRLCGWMTDVKDDDQLVFTYLPGGGTTVEVQGETRGTIPGKDFADALFACWIGPEPPGEDFKTGLLGG